MAEILDTAQGSVPADIEQIKTAVYGREVRASIAEALSLLYAGLTLDDGSTVKDKLAALLEDTSLTKEQLETLLENIYNIGVYQDLSQVSTDHKRYMHYADGTTSVDAYNAGIREVVYKGRRYIINEDGTVTPYLAMENENLDFDKLHCGYKYRIKTNADGTTTITSILLFDQNADKISADENGYRRQGCFLYDDNGLVGFVTNLTSGSNITISYITGYLQSHGSAISNINGKISTISTDIRALNSRIAVVEAFVNSITNVAEVGA